MKKVALFVFLAAFALSASAQVHKLFTNKKGDVTKDSTKAVSYTLYQRLPDSSWLATQFSMGNALLFRGTYLDEELSMPHGKASYYSPVFMQRKVGEHESVKDTSIKLSRTGYFLNGRKEGVWVDYHENGEIKLRMPYLRDTLDGQFQEFAFDGSLLRQGSYLMGDREGDWFMYYSDSTVQVKSLFRKNHLMDMEGFDRKDEARSAYPNFNFNRYINKSFKSKGLPLLNGNVIISFTITKEGKLIDPKLEMGINETLDNAVLEAVKNSPVWVSAKKKKTPVEQHLNFVFFFKNTKDDDD